MPASPDDGQDSCGDGHPVLYCAELDFRHPALLRALVHIPADRDNTILWIPYTHVLGILELPDAKGSGKEAAEKSTNVSSAMDASSGSESASSARYH